MKLTDKRFWSWRVSITLLIISFLIAIVVLFKRAFTTDAADIERVGKEVVSLIDDFQSRTGRLPAGLTKLGVPFKGDSGTYEYQGCIFYYEQRKDGAYWLTVTFGSDMHYSYCSLRNYWLWDYDTAMIAERKEQLFKEVFQSYKPVWKYDSLRANTDSINTIYPFAPDSLIYCRQYYEDGQKAGCSKIGTGN